MPKLITFDQGVRLRHKPKSKQQPRQKGSKWRLREIRWTLFEVFTLALLTGFALTVATLVLLAELRDIHPYSKPTEVPAIKYADPILARFPLGSDEFGNQRSHVDKVLVGRTPAPKIESVDFMHRDAERKLLA